MKIPQRANHKTMSGIELLKKVMSTFKTKEQLLTETNYERNEQKERSKETKKR